VKNIKINGCKRKALKLSMIAIRTVEMHTCGEPVRIIVKGYPEFPDIPETKSILGKRAFALKHFDEIRQRLMLEPRGHQDNYGAIVVPTSQDCDLAVLFMHCEGYSTMCGHATIALGRFAVDHGFKNVTREELKDEQFASVQVKLEVPCGIVVVDVPVKYDLARQVVKSDPLRPVSFESVQCFCVATDLELKGLELRNGRVLDITKDLDLSYGGTFYALLPASHVGLDLETSSLEEIVDTADRITKLVRKQYGHLIKHPDGDLMKDVEFLYGTILTDGKHGETEASLNICVFADKEIDRSPTGSGVSARLAAQYARKLVSLNDETRKFKSVTGGIFGGRVVQALDSTIRVQVSGQAYYCGSCEWTFEDEDPLKNGFILRH
jgi:proline racemase